MIQNLRNILISEIQKAMSINQNTYETMMEYHESGQDSDSLPNLGGVFYQP
jgi:hypothetical protein